MADLAKTAIYLNFPVILTLFFCWNGRTIWAILSLLLTFATGFYLKYVCRPPINDDKNRKVLIIGAGVSGIACGARLHEAGFRNFTIIEKSSNFGGTWWDNKYPNCACDVPSHFYSYSFHLNPRWSRLYSDRQEIWTYLKDVTTRYNLRPKIEYNKHVDKAVWNDTTKKWLVTLKDESTIECDIIFNCTGALHVPNIPQFKGAEDFKGPKMHTALWDETVDVTGKRVAVIGTGASAVQTVPGIADKVKDLYVFQRTAAWSFPRFNYTYPAWMKTLFEKIPLLTYIHRYFIFWRNEAFFHIMFVAGTRLGKVFQDLMEKGIRSVVKDEELQKALTPHYSPGCKRITPSDSYLAAFNKPNVHLVTEKLDRFNEGGILTADGKQYDVDVIIYATGFDVLKSAKPYHLVGQNGVVMENQCGDTPNAYLGVAMPNCPNWFAFLGPNTGLGHSSVLYMIECEVDYAIDCLRTLVQTGKKSMTVKQEVHQRYMDMIHKHMQTKVFNQGCSSWYSNDRGINFTLWPRNLVVYWWYTLTCRKSDYNFE